MFTHLKIRNSIIALMLVTQSATAGQFVVELDAPFILPKAMPFGSFHVRIDETMSAGADSYAVFSATDKAALEYFLQAASIKPEMISEVLFVNSPEIGGGLAANSNPQNGHLTYVIERPIPGVGFFGIEKWRNISNNSNVAMAKLGDAIEWEHSYLTGEGTYCVYRADSPETLREHGTLAGAPIGKITEVVKEIH